MKKRGTKTTSASNKKAKTATSSKNGNTSAAAKKKAKGSLSRDDKIKEMDAKILKVMMMFHMEEKPNVKVDDVANELCVHIRSKGFRDRWSFLKNTKNLIGKSKSDNGLALTKIGLEEAATPEYREMMKDLAITPKTNLEHQERLKKHLKKSKSIAIFDFLLKYGSLSKAELSPLVGQNARSHGFHYSFKELTVRGYVEVDPDYSGKGKKFRLANKAFKGKDDRPKEIDIDAEHLIKELAVGVARIESQKQSSSKKPAKGKTVKNEGSDCAKAEEMEPKKEDDEMNSYVKEVSEDEIKTKHNDAERPNNLGTEKEKSNTKFVAANSALNSVISIDSNSDSDSDHIIEEAELPVSEELLEF